MRSRFVVLLVLLCVGHCVADEPKEWTEPVTQTISTEMAEWGIDGVAVALVDGQELVFAMGFGEAQRNSIFRVGSISKLFNALAVMQQVEQERLDLDAPLPAHLLPLNPFPGNPSVTLRQILCHRSGLQREGAVGGYLDSSAPGLSASVASLRVGVLVTEPGTKMRYSNIAPSLAGFWLAERVGQSFTSYQESYLLKPMGMADSFWLTVDLPPNRMMRSFMRVADGRGGWTRIETPLFDLGTIPAGNLFSTVDDLARLASVLLAGGDGIVRGDTLAAMWRPQLTKAKRGFGLGFVVGDYRGHRSVGHSGAVYGHSSSFVVLPDVGLACIVLANEDIANGRVRAISDFALNALLKERRDVAVPAPPSVVSLPPRLLKSFVGSYESESFWATLTVRDGVLEGDLSGQLTRFRFLSDTEALVDNRITSSGRVLFDRDENGVVRGFRVSGQNYVRLRDRESRLRDEWRSLIGTYGHEFVPLIVRERFGHLYVMTENMVDYRLRPVNRHVWSLSPGMYVDEEVVFLPDRSGQVNRINFANMVFDRTGD